MEFCEKTFRRIQRRGRPVKNQLCGFRPKRTETKEGRIWIQFCCCNNNFLVFCNDPLKIHLILLNNPVKEVSSHLSGHFAVLYSWWVPGWSSWWYKLLLEWCWVEVSKFENGYKGSLQNKFLVKVGNLAQPTWPPPPPRTLGFFPWIFRKFSAKKGQICHKNSVL